MAEVYVTLSEAAELEGVQYQTMARRTQRNKKNFVTKTEKSKETVRKDVVLVAVSHRPSRRERMEGTGEAETFHGRTSDKKEDGAEAGSAMVCEY